MAVTKTFSTQIGNDFYEPSDTPDMVYKWSRSEVYLRGIEMSLENQIKRLEEQIKAPAIEPAPVMPIPTEELEKQKTELQVLFDKLEGVK